MLRAALAFCLCLFVIASTAVFYQCASSSKSKTKVPLSATQVPGWLDEAPKLCAVGVSGRTYFKSEAENNAVVQARVELSKIIRAKILTLDIAVARQDSDYIEQLISVATDADLHGSVVKGVWHDELGLAGHKGNTYALVCMNVDPDFMQFVKRIEKDFNAQTSAQITRDLRSLFDGLKRLKDQAGKDAAEVSRCPFCARTGEEKPAFCLEVPDWMKDQIRQKGNLYVVVSVGKTYYKSEALTIGEEKAREELGRSLCSHIRSIWVSKSDKTGTGVDYAVIQERCSWSTEVVEVGMKVVASWYDEAGLCGFPGFTYVLACLPLNPDSIASQAAETEPPKTTAEIREKASRLFEELEQLENREP